MKSLSNALEGLLDADFDITTDDIMPKAGQVLIDIWSRIPKKYGRSHNNGSGWLMDYETSSQALKDTGIDLNRVRKNLITKKEAYEYIWATGSKANEDGCIICVVGEPNNPYSVGIGRPSTADALFFTESTGYDKGKWVAQGLIKDSDFIRNAEGSYGYGRKTVYTLIEGIVNNKIKRKFWLLPGYCFDVIKNQILNK